MAQSNSTKPIESHVRRSLRCRTQHRRVWFAHVVIFSLLGSSLSASIQITEIVPTTILSLQPGKLNFAAGLKRKNSNNVGTFVYHEFAAPSTTNSQKLRFFDAEPLPGFVHNYELTVAKAGQLFRNLYNLNGANPGYLIYNRSSTHNAIHNMLYIQVASSTAGADFTIPTAFDATWGGAGTRFVPLKSDDLVPRLAGRSTKILFRDCSTNPPVDQAEKTTTVESANMEYIDQVSKIGNYALYMHRSGLLVWDDETVPNSNVLSQIQTVADFQPKFAVKDSSRVCTTSNCDVIVFQERNSNVYHLSMLNVKITSAPTVGTLKFASLDVTSVATVNFPITVPSLQFVALTGSDRFYLYRIFDDRFQAHLDFDSVTFTGMEPGSLEVGDFNTALYPNQRPVMAMFAEGGAYKAKMFVLKAPVCANTACATCDISGTCTSCKAGAIDYLGYCTTCGTTAPAAIFVDNGIPTCVDTSTGTYATGHGRDTTVTTFVLIKPCTLSGCSLCSADFNTCTGCSAGNIFYLNKCTTCGSTAPAAIFVDNGTPTCVSTITGTYATGHGPDTTITAFVLIKPCTLSGCSLCSANFETCTQCTTGQVLDLNKCITPPGSNPSTNNPSPAPTDPNTSSNNTGSSPTDSGTQPKIPDPEVAANKLSTYTSVVTNLPYVNAFALTLRPGQSLDIDSVFMVDLDSSKVYTCGETNCRYTLKNRFLRVSFKPSFTITKGLVIIRRKQRRTSIVTKTQNSDTDRDRLLQIDTEDFSDVVIPGLTLTRTTGYTEWMTTGQVMLFVLRTVGSVVVFPKYPRLAMIPDLLITISLMICMLLGPVMYSASIALTSISQIKIPWYYFDSVVEDWDTDTLSLPTSPNTWNHPVFTSFLDNYSQNTVGLCALAVVLAVVWFVARRVTRNNQSSPRSLRIAAAVQQHYGMKFWFAKVHANSLEMMMYSLISFDKADASSKSVIGVVLALVLVGFQVWLAAGATVLSVTRVDTVTPPPTAGQIEIIDPSQVGTTNSPGSAPDTTSIKQKTLRVLVAGWQFIPTSTLKQVSRSKSFTDTAFFLRNLGLCVIALKLIASAQAQLIVATCLQSLYLTYFVYCNAHRERIEHYSTLSVEAVALAIMLVKTVSTTSSISDSALQNTLGSLTFVFLTIVILSVFISFALAFMRSWKSQQIAAHETTNLTPFPTSKANSNPVQLHSEKAEQSSNLKYKRSLHLISSDDHPNMPEEDDFPPPVPAEKVFTEDCNNWEVPEEQKGGTC